MEILTESLKKLTTLEILHLDFTYCGDFGDEYLVKLSDSLKGLTNLKKLRLKFIFEEQMTQESLMYLADVLKSLQVIELKFYLYEKMREEGMRNFTEQLIADANEDDYFFSERRGYYQFKKPFEKGFSCINQTQENL